jgi:hypothetical protein
MRVILSSSSAYLCPHCWGTGLSYGLPTRRTGHKTPRGLSADCWVLTTANTAGANGLTCLPKHGLYFLYKEQANDSTPPDIKWKWNPNATIIGAAAATSPYCANQRRPAGPQGAYSRLV